MQTIKNDLVNELRNEKYYLEKELVRLLNENNSVPYKARLLELKTVFEKITTVNATLLTVDGYLSPPVQENVVNNNVVNNEEKVENDVVTGVPNEVPSVKSPVPHQGQTHAE